MGRYSFLTTWALDAPIEQVFDALHDPPAYPSWWKGVEEVERLEQGDADGVGSLDRYVWKSKLPYRLEFRSRTTRVERPHLMEGHAIGELEGDGRWRLWQGPVGTCVTYDGCPDGGQVEHDKRCVEVHSRRRRTVEHPAQVAVDESTKLEGDVPAVGRHRVDVERSAAIRLERNPAAVR